MTKPYDLIVIGAGMAGVSAANKCAAQGTCRPVMFPSRSCRAAATGSVAMSTASRSVQRFSFSSGARNRSSRTTKAVCHREGRRSATTTVIAVSFTCWLIVGTQRRFACLTPVVAQPPRPTRPSHG